jgi:hypothetical protein
MPRALSPLCRIHTGTRATPAAGCSAWSTWPARFGRKSSPLDSGIREAYWRLVNTMLLKIIGYPFYAAFQIGLWVSFG